MVNSLFEHLTFYFGLRICCFCGEGCDCRKKYIFVLQVVQKSTLWEAGHSLFVSNPSKLFELSCWLLFLCKWKEGLAGSCFYMEEIKSNFNQNRGVYMRKILVLYCCKTELQSSILCFDGMDSVFLFPLSNKISVKI